MSLYLIAAIKMAVTKDKERITAYITKNLKAEAEQAARMEGRSLSNYIEQLIKRDITKKEVKVS